MTAHQAGKGLRGDQMAFALTVVSALVPSLITLRSGASSPQWWALLSCGVVYVAGGFLDFSNPDLRGRKWWLAATFTVQTLMLAGIFSITKIGGMSVLLAFPLVGQAVACLPGIAAGVFVAALYAGILTAGALLGGKKDLLIMGSSVAAGFGFVAAFTRNAVREKQARAEAERLSAELTAANARLRSHAASIEELAMTRERNRLAREIHDSLGHALTTMAVQLEVAATVQASDPPRALEAVQKAHGLATEALADVRHSVGVLRAEPGKPLADRVRQLVASDERLTVNFSLLGEPRALAGDAEHGLFRVAQEGLTNVRKHARAQAAWLTLDYRNAQQVTVSIADDGRGCAQPRPGYGLTGLRERSVLLGGTFTAANRPEGGFLVCLEVAG